MRRIGSPAALYMKPTTEDNADAATGKTDTSTMGGNPPNVAGIKTSARPANATMQMPLHGKTNTNTTGVILLNAIETSGQPAKAGVLLARGITAFVLD